MRRGVALLAFALAVVLPTAAAVLPPCAPAIRPGANSNLCTINFLVSDGTETYVGLAGHCGGLGARLNVAGVGSVGTVILNGLERHVGDWAFARIDPEDRAKANPTMCRFGGPSVGPFGTDVRTPNPGELVVHYGHGVAAGSMEDTRGRAGPALGNPLGGSAFFFVSNVAGGDSGSPVRLITGEAAGIAVATFITGYVPNLVLASRFDLAMADLGAFLGRDVVLLHGDPLPELPVG